MQTARKRFNNTLKVIIILFLMCITINTLMWSLSRTYPRLFWVPKQFFGIDFVKENYYKSQSLIRAIDSQNEVPDTSLVVVLGLSGASEGISLKRMRGEVSSKVDLVSLSGAGKNINEIELYAKPLVEGGVIPELVVFAISPFHFVHDEKIATGFDGDDFFNKVMVGWILNKRGDIQHLFELLSYKARNLLFSFFNVHTERMTTSPWSESKRMNIQPLQNEGEWINKVNEYRYRGYYKLSSYENSQTQYDKFNRLLAHFINAGADVLVTFMPEHERLYENIPSNSMAIIRSAIQLKDQVYFFDIRTALHSDKFNDISHTNEKGREEISKLLGVKVNEILGKN